VSKCKLGLAAAFLVAAAVYTTSPASADTFLVGTYTFNLVDVTVDFTTPNSASPYLGTDTFTGSFGWSCGNSNGSGCEVTSGSFVVSGAFAAGTYACSAGCSSGVDGNGIEINLTNGTTNFALGFGSLFGDLCLAGNTGCGVTSGVQGNGTTDDILNWIYVGSNGYSPPDVAYTNAEGGYAQITPIPAALPLFATGLGAMGLFGWRRKRKIAAALAAA
jgi:hypothetical protein